MAFVNEEISGEDFERCLEIINKRWIAGGYTRDWTIDRERKIWLRLYLEWTDKENFGAEFCTYWDFYWKGNFVSVKTKFIKRTRYDNGEAYGYIKILELEIPEDIQQHKQEILKDLKEAFEASFLGLGIYRDPAKTKTCRADLEYEGELV